MQQKCFRLLFLFLSILYIQSNQAYSQPYPGAEGFGAVTKAAYGSSVAPKILVVDNLGHGQTGDPTTGRGTFLWCLKQNYPRVIVFEVSGTIDFKAHQDIIYITSPYLTIAGQTAPGDGINIINTSIHIKTHDVLIQHIRIRTGDGDIGIDFNGRDCLDVEGYNVVIDHCSFAWGIDEVLSLVGNAHNVTISNNIIAEPLDKSYHYNVSDYRNQPQWHGYAMLTSFGTKNITLQGNIIAFATGRSPMVRSQKAVIVNNLMYNSGNSTVGPSFYGGDTSIISYVSNIALPVDEPKIEAAKYAGTITGSFYTKYSRYYVHDNISLKQQQENVQGENNIYKFKDDATFVSKSPIELSKYSIVPASNLEQHILAHAGAKPERRDAVDARVINNIKNRTGGIVDSPFPTPASAYNMSRDHATGYMKDGHNWAGNPSEFYINNKKITLNKNCSNADEVVQHIKPQLPSGTEVYRVNNLHYIGFKTTAKGSSQKLELKGAGLKAFGIDEGVYNGKDGVGGFPQLKHEKTSLAIPQNPHADDNKNGFTNLQDWLHSLTTGQQKSLSKPILKDEQEFFVDENVKPGYILGTVKAENTDEQKVHFCIIDDNKDIFNLDGNTGALSLNNNQQLDYESNQYYEIKAAIRKDDANGSIIHSDFIRIHVNNQNESPEFISSPGRDYYSATDLYEYSIKFNDQDSDDILSISAKELADWLILEQLSNETALLSGFPPAGYTGELPIELVLNDGQSAAVQKFNISFVNQVVEGITEEESAISADLSNITTNPELNVFPNPSDGHINVAMENNLSTYVDFVLYSIEGKRIKSFSFYSNGNQVNRQFDFSFLKNGLYLLVANIAGKTYEQKVLITK